MYRVPVQHRRVPTVVLTRWDWKINSITIRNSVFKCICLSTRWKQYLGYLCSSYASVQKTAGDVSKQDTVPDTAGNAVIGAEEAIKSPTGVTTITTIGVIAQTVYNVLSVRLLPQPTAVEDTLKIVKRLEVLALPNDGPQYKHVEDTILRALNDMLRIPTGKISDMQRVLLLETAWYIDSEVILLLEALLGERWPVSTCWKTSKSCTKRLFLFIKLEFLKNRVLD